MRVLTGAVLLTFSTPLAAEPAISYPVQVPQECAQLAEREHVPVVIANRYQALKAEYKLARLSKTDPMVAQCKEAVERLSRTSSTPIRARSSPAPRSPVCLPAMASLSAWMAKAPGGTTCSLSGSGKYEEVYLHAYETVAEARIRSAGISTFYNGRRPHSSLDDMTPDQAYFNLPPLRAAA
jgi:Integrase core domain